METYSALLVLCAGNSPVTGEFPAQRSVMWNFDVYFDLHLNKQLSKQSWGWWFEMPSHPLWRHHNVTTLWNKSLSLLKSFYFSASVLKWIDKMCSCHHINRADSMFVPSQWETSLQSSAIFHYLGAKLESALHEYFHYLPPVIMFYIYNIGRQHTFLQSEWIASLVGQM